MRTLVWFRGKDLRIADHAPLVSALERGPFVPLFVLDPYFFAPERAAKLPNRIQFLLDALGSLAKNLEHAGSRLVVVRGRSVDEVPRIAKQLGVERVVAHRWTEPFARERDQRIAAALDPQGVRFELFEGETLVPPGTVRTGQGGVFSVFTPFSKAVAKRLGELGEPLPAPKRLPALPASLGLDEVAIPTMAELGLTPNPRVIPGGERAARARLEAFVKGALSGYAADRDRMDLEGTSRLSADLKFGTISIRAVYQRALEAERRGQAPPEQVAKFTSELVWREFAYHTLFDRPELLERPFRRAFEGFPWRDDEPGWQAWVEGRTGYPVVDAAARQLLAEGYVHNRARMIAASFLTKHLMIDFRRGEAHYMEHLVDGDWCSNDLGWQWSAGSGCDAQPYFRIFNPVSQGERFDPDGAYVRRWVPELVKLPPTWIHQPFEAPPEVLAKAGVRLGVDYPRPVVGLSEGRDRFLATAKQHFGSEQPPPEG
jgi:deoxyribodipyrimidine photo-lyase